MNKGITLIQLIIAIVIMVILASTVIFYAQEVPGEARIAKVYNEIRELKSTMKQFSILDEINEVEDEGVKKLDLAGEIMLNEVTTDKNEENGYYIKQDEFSEITQSDDSDGYYYMDFTTSKSLQRVLGLENMENDYIINGKNLNLYLIKGVTMTIDNEPTIKYSANDIEQYYEETFVNK